MAFTRAGIIAALDDGRRPLEQAIALFAFTYDGQILRDERGREIRRGTRAEILDWLYHMAGLP